MHGDELRRTLDLHAHIRRVYADDRFPPPSHIHGDLRHYAITVAWVTHVERTPKGARWKRIFDLMHYRDDDMGAYRFWRMISSDAPRYEPPGRPRVNEGGCEAPMIRRDGNCGQRGNQSFRVTNPTDGTWRSVSYCARHTDHARRVHDDERRRIKAGGIPEPLPNRGGLLPCYMDWNWPDQYAKARPGWKPPAVGICADDWPTMARVIAYQPKPPPLTLISGDRTTEVTPLPTDDQSSAPTLRIVRPAEPDCTECGDQPAAGTCCGGCGRDAVGRTET